MFRDYLEALLRFKRNSDDLCSARAVQTLREEIRRDVLAAFELGEEFVEQHPRLYDDSSSFVDFIFKLLEIRAPERSDRSIRGGRCRSEERKTSRDRSEYDCDREGEKKTTTASHFFSHAQSELESILKSDDILRKNLTQLSSDIGIVLHGIEEKYSMDKQNFSTQNESLKSYLGRFSSDISNFNRLFEKLREVVRARDACDPSLGIQSSIGNARDAFATHSQDGEQRSENAAISPSSCDSNYSLLPPSNALGPTLEFMKAKRQADEEIAMLRKKFSEKEEDLSNCGKQLQFLNEKVNGLQSAMEKSEREKSDLERKLERCLSANQSSVVDQTSEILEIKKKGAEDIRALRTTVDEKEQNLSDSRRKVQLMNEHITLLESRVKKSKQKEDDLEINFDRCSRELSKAKSEMEDWQFKLESEKRTIKEIYTEKFEKLEKDAEKRSELHNEELKRFQRKYEVVLEEKLNEIENLREKKESELEEKRTEIDELRRKLEHAREEKRDEVEKLQKRHKGALDEKRREISNAKLASFGKEEDALRVAELEAKNQRLAKEIVRLEEELAKFSSKKSVDDDVRMEEERDHSLRKDTESSLRVRIAELETLTQQLGMRSQENLSKMDDDRKMQQTNEKITILENEVDKLEGERNDLAKEFDRCSNELSQAKSEIDEWKSRLEYRETTFQNLHLRNLNQMERLENDIKVKMASHNDEMEEMRRQHGVVLEQKQTDIENLRVDKENALEEKRREIDYLRRETDDTKGKLERALEEKRDEVIELQIGLEDALDERQEEVSKTQRVTLEDARKKRGRMAVRKGRRGEERCNIRIAALEMKNESLRTEVARLEGELRESLSKKSGGDDHGGDVTMEEEGDRSRLDAEPSRLRDRVRELEAQSLQLQTRLESRVAEVESLRAESASPENPSDGDSPRADGDSPRADGHGGAGAETPESREGARGEMEEYASFAEAVRAHVEAYHYEWSGSPETPPSLREWLEAWKESDAATLSRIDGLVSTSFEIDPPGISLYDERAEGEGGGRKKAVTFKNFLEEIVRLLRNKQEELDDLRGPFPAAASPEVETSLRDELDDAARKNRSLSVASVRPEATADGENELAWDDDPTLTQVQDPFLTDFEIYSGLTTIDERERFVIFHVTVTDRYSEGYKAVFRYVEASNVLVDEYLQFAAKAKSVLDTEDVAEFGPPSTEFRARLLEALRHYVSIGEESRGAAAPVENYLGGGGEDSGLGAKKKRETGREVAVEKTGKRRKEPKDEHVAEGKGRYVGRRRIPLARPRPRPLRLQPPRVKVDVRRSTLRANFVRIREKFRDFVPRDATVTMDAWTESFVERVQALLLEKKELTGFKTVVLRQLHHLRNFGQLRRDLSFERMVPVFSSATPENFESVVVDYVNGVIAEKTAVTERLSRLRSYAKTCLSRTLDAQRRLPAVREGVVCVLCRLEMNFDVPRRFECDRDHVYHDACLAIDFDDGNFEFACRECGADLFPDLNYVVESRPAGRGEDGEAAAATTASVSVGRKKRKIELERMESEFVQEINKKDNIIKEKTHKIEQLNEQLAEKVDEVAEMDFGELIVDSSHEDELKVVIYLLYHAFVMLLDKFNRGTTDESLFPRLFENIMALDSKLKRFRKQGSLASILLDYFVMHVQLINGSIKKPQISVMPKNAEDYFSYLVTEARKFLHVSDLRMSDDDDDL